MRSQTTVRVWLALLTVLLIVGVACNKAASDSEVSSQVQSQLAGDSGLQDKGISVETAAGVVTLSGTVANDGQRTAASRYAASIPGVKQVINNLQVETAVAKPTPRPLAPPRPKHVSKPAPTVTHHRAVRHSSTMAATPHAPIAPAPEQSPAQASPPASSQAVTAPVAAMPSPPPPPRKVTLATGTTLTIRLVDEIDSETAEAGQSFKATLDAPLSVDGDVVIPAQYDVQGHIVEVKSAGKFAGQSELVLQLDQIQVGHRQYSIQTDQYRREGSSRGKNTAKKVGAGAAIGAIIGGIAGGGKGAAIGAAAGGGVGGGVQAATKGQQIKLPPETVLSFSLQAPLTVTAVTEGPNASRPKLEPPQ